MLLLEDVLSLTRSLNEGIAIQEEQVGIVSLDKKRARTLITPQFNLKAEYEHPDKEIVFGEDQFRADHSWRGSVTLTQPLIDLRVPASYSAAKVGITVAENNLATEARLQLLEAARLYYSFLQAAKQIEVAEESLKLASNETVRARARFDAGEVRKTEQLRAEVDEARAERTLTEAGSALEIARAELARQIGWTARTVYEIAPARPIAGAQTNDLEKLIGMALENRTEVQAVVNGIDRLELERKVVRRQRWPTLDAEYRHNFVDPETIAEENDSWTFLVIASFDPWDGGNIGIELERIDMELDQAELRLRQTEKAVSLEVERVYRDILTLEDNLLTLAKEVELADEQYRTLSEQARVGEATSLDVSTALVALSQAKSLQVRTHYTYEFAKLTLQQVLGLFPRDITEDQTEYVFYEKD
ncbi:MAG: TolC family protein [Verrucomicrobia bacterium]|nr:TolC family protein [Verrucomicrobiota bacterium]